MTFPAVDCNYWSNKRGYHNIHNELLLHSNTITSYSNNNPNICIYRRHTCSFPTYTFRGWQRAPADSPSHAAHSGGERELEQTNFRPTILSTGKKQQNCSYCTPVIVEPLIASFPATRPIPRFSTQYYRGKKLELEWAWRKFRIYAHWGYMCHCVIDRGKGVLAMVSIHRLLCSPNQACV